jgi:hypothetical protein
VGQRRVQKPGSAPKHKYVHLLSRSTAVAVLAREALLVSTRDPHDRRFAVPRCYPHHLQRHPRLLLASPHRLRLVHLPAPPLRCQTSCASVPTVCRPPPRRPRRSRLCSAPQHWYCCAAWSAAAGEPVEGCPAPLRVSPLVFVGTLSEPLLSAYTPRPPPICIWCLPASPAPPLCLRTGRSVTSPDPWDIKS